MLDLSTTTSLLLENLKSPNKGVAWREFDGRYRPILMAVGRKLGLREDEAADAAQETLLRFAKAYQEGQYDPARGRLRSWILGILKYRVADALARRAADRRVAGDSELGQIPAEDELNRVWEDEHRNELLRLAVRELRQTTRTSDRSIAAFEMLVWERQSAGQIAKRLGMTVQDVYMAKRRVADRIREIVTRLEAVYCEEPGTA